MGDPTVVGMEELVAQLDVAVQHESVEEITAGVQAILTDILGNGKLQLPESMKVPLPGTYARRLVYKSDRYGYVVIAMTWGPGQSTPLHDHCGSWCVEGVMEGVIDVTQYELVEKQGDRWRFSPCGKIHSEVGSAGSLIPPFEYHTMANAVADTPSITLHVYEHELQRCTIFEASPDGWYDQQIRTLSYAH